MHWSQFRTSRAHHVARLRTFFPVDISPSHLWVSSICPHVIPFSSPSFAGSFQHAHLPVPLALRMQSIAPIGIGWLHGYERLVCRVEAYRDM